MKKCICGEVMHIWMRLFNGYNVLMCPNCESRITVPVGQEAEKIACSKEGRRLLTERRSEVTGRS